MNEKVMLDAARERIQAKDYDAARAFLSQIPKNPTAQQWLQRLDQIAPAAKPQATRGGNRIITYPAAILGGIIMTFACLLLFFAFQDGDLPLPAPMYEAVGICPAGQWVGNVNPILEEFGDVGFSARYAPRISVGTYLGDLNRLEREFNDVNTPDCMDEPRDEVAAGMSTFIEGISAFARNEDDLTVAFFLDSSVTHFQTAYDYTLEEHGKVLKLFRLTLN